MRHHLDCADAIYNQALNESPSNRIEGFQYKAALAINLARQESSQ